MATHTARRAQPWKLAAGALLLVTTSACGAGPTPTAAPLPLPVVAPVVEATAEPVDVHDAALIEEYWNGRQQAWDAGVSSGIAFLVSHLHPELPYTAEDCTDAWFGPTPPVRFIEHSTLDPDSLQRDADWTMQTGPLQDTEVDGDVYVMHVDIDYEGVPAYWAGRRTETHLEVFDGRVHNFLRCDVPQVTISALDTGGSGPVTPTPTTSPSPIRTAPPITLPPLQPYVPAPVRPPAPTQRPSTPTPTPPAPPPAPPATPSPSPDPTVPPGEGSPDPGSGLDFCSGEEVPAGDYRICPEDAADS